MSPRQPTPDNDESATEDPKHNRPGEVRRDEERDDRGIVYHGADWDRAEEENERGVVEHRVDADDAKQGERNSVEDEGVEGDRSASDDGEDRDFDNEETQPGRG